MVSVRVFGKLSFPWMMSIGSLQEKLLSSIHKKNDIFPVSKMSFLALPAKFPEAQESPPAVCYCSNSVIRRNCCQILCSSI